MAWVAGPGATVRMSCDPRPSPSPAAACFSGLAGGDASFSCSSSEVPKPRSPAAVVMDLAAQPVSRRGRENEG